MRSEELTLPGFVHDVCSAVHPLAVASPFFREIPLAEHGVELIQPPAALAHPFDDGTAAVLERSVEETGRTLGPDAAAWRRVFDPLTRAAETLLDETLGPLRPLRAARHPFLLGRFGLQALRPAAGFAQSAFDGERARALFAGSAAHSMLPLTQRPTAAFGLMLTMLGHSVGWPIPRGGSRRLAEALVSHLRELGGELETGRRVASLDELPPARAVLLDLTPRQILSLAGDRLPSRYRRRLERYRYGPGVFKLDLALDGPVPWRAAECGRAATVHLGGTLEELVAAE
jgi:phytoene dehydrogenase-like protein